MTNGAPVSHGAPVSRAASTDRRVKRDALMYLVALMDLTYIWRIQDILTPLAVIKFPTLVGLTALALYAIDKRRVRRLRFVRSPVVVLLLGFAFVIVAGVPTSLLASSTVEFLMKDFLPNVFMAVLIAACVRGTRDLDWLLGAHMIGANVSEMVEEAVLAFEFRGSSEDIGITVHSHPTLSEAVKEAALGVLGRSIHI